ncbi:hypothetical protein [Sinorhizobium meliloti]|uniref:hypothetical protein n=1 Tax=Rhizobium meliloti TaxID=382 RepID=UPI000FDB8675|nr:hypothetical protein [Sinorhizobium meliloti]RVN54352.1 hypothetical protein CN108_18365 [Sinorhizobium meliloti]
MKNIANYGNLQSVPGRRLSHAERRRGKRIGSNPRNRKEGEPSCPLLLHLRPLTIADMAPGYPYEPGLTLLTVMTWPVFGDDNRSAVGFDSPVRLPAEYREFTPQNARIALDLLCAVDPEAAAMVDDLKRLARQPKSRRFANSPAADSFLASLRPGTQGGADCSATEL